MASILVAGSALAMTEIEPASAALGDPGQVSLQKSVAVDGAVGTPEDLGPGDSFTYSFLVGCDDNPCINAQLHDQIPAELTGFDINTLTVAPSTATVGLDGCAVPGTVTEDCRLDGTFETPLNDPGSEEPLVGIEAGETYRINLTLTVPTDLSPTWPHNGEPVINEATVTADNSGPATDRATIAATVDVVTDVSATKAWATDSAQHQPGADAPFTIGGANTSNVPATQLVLTDPAGATDGATALEADNPFNFVDFDSLCSPSTLPEGADTAQVDLYVFDGAAWSWVTGTPGLTPTAPEVTGDVGGIRLTYTSSTGATITAGGDAAEQCVDTVQRATDRSTGDPLTAGATVVNTVGAVLTVPDQEPAEATATDTFTIAPLTVAITPQKTIDRDEIAAGDRFGVDLGVRNDSNGPLTSLTIAEPADPENAPFLSEDLVFDAFTSWTWPAGATDATFRWVFDDGTESADIALDPTSPPPTAPAGVIAGFVIDYTGDIAAGTTAGIAYSVRTEPTTVPEGTESLSFDNVIEATGTNAAGTDTRTADDDITVYYPEIDLSLDKTVRPGLVTPGGTVVVELEGKTAANRPTVDPTRIVIEDAWDGTADTDFWDAFRARSISFTDVPADSTMTIHHATGTPPALTWTETVVGVTDLYSVDLSTLVADPDDIVGLRFTFDNPDGFAQGTIVKPNIVFEASDELRDGTPTTENEDEPVTYDNVAQARGSGRAGDIEVESDPVLDEGQVEIIRYGGGPGTLLSAKRWVEANWSTDLNALQSQSGATARTRHGWGVTVPGHSQVQLIDAVPGSETDPSATVFQAFDLTAIRPISFTDDPLLRWDEVTQIELFDGTAWQTVPAPGGSWMNATGFKGHTLTAAQAASTTGVRVTVIADDAAREASTEPGRPAPGTGVASSASSRLFGLQWRLRNVVRVPATDPASRWATSEFEFNDGEGTVENTFRVSATLDGQSRDRDSSDSILLLDAPPNVGVRKRVDPDRHVVPHPGDVPPEGYPTGTYTVDAWNASSSRASYLRVSDPMPCSTTTDCVADPADPDPDVFTGNTYDPATNPFERFTLTGVDVEIPASVPIDTAVSQVALWRYDDGDTTVDTMSIDALRALDADALADVVGISVVYQSTDPAETGGLIPRGSTAGNGSNLLSLVLHTQLRPTLRSDQTVDVTGGVEVNNVAQAQTHDPVLGASDAPHAESAVPVTLVAGHLDVTASKTITPGTILETSPDEPITVTLGATDGSANVSAETASIIDVDEEFWQTFRLVDLGAVTRPAGADLVRVDVQVNGTDDWIEGAAAPDAALPAEISDLSTVTGIRFVFLNEPTRPFSATAPPARWSAEAIFTAELRDGITFPGSLDNTVQTRATHRGHPDATASDDAPIVLSTGTPRIDVRKESIPPPKTAEPGVSNLWTLEFTNSGDAFYDINEVLDDLGPSLRWDGTVPTYETTSAIAVDEITVDQTDPSNLTFTFPEGSRLAPGETVTISVGIVLQPGLSSGQRATNGFIVDTTATFGPGACTNTSGNGQGLLDDLEPNQCGTTNYVSPQSGPLLLTDKTVKGEIDGDLVTGATNTANPTLPCLADSEGFHRRVCAAHTAIGATDEWKVDAINTGTVAYESLTVVDVLPIPGDRMLATGAARGSEWRPVFDLDWGVQFSEPLPADATHTVEVTTADAPCVGTGSGSDWNADRTCSQHPPPSEWSLLDEFTGDPAAITAIRVNIDFGTPLAPAGHVQLRFRTINEPWAEGDVPTAEAVVPELHPDGPTQKAWNQVGVTAGLVAGGSVSRAPAKTGVELHSGALEIAKDVEGATDFAPDSIPFELACTVPGSNGPVPVDLGDQDVIVVPTNGTARVDGLPLGATCDITEAGELGDFGETVRTPDAPQTVHITDIVAPNDDIAETQSVSFSNTYEFATLEVSKLVDEQTNPAVTFGPWDFSLECTAAFPTSTEVFSDTFTIDAAGESWSLPAGIAPAGATCVLTELTGADAIDISGAGVTDEGDGSAIIELGTETIVAVTNGYAVGTLEVAKERIGEGVERYGVGPFEVDVVCTLDSTVVHRGSITLDEDGDYTGRLQHDGEDAWLPAGSICELTETLTAGSTGEPVFSPADEVTIDGGEPGDDAEDHTTVTVTNVFDVGEITVAKAIEGDGAELYGTGPFEVRLQCVYDRDGEETFIEWNGEPHLDLRLDADNGYQQTVQGLLVDSSCEVISETVTGGATEVVIGDAFTVPRDADDPVTITVTNTFDAADLDIVKERIGDGVAERGTGPFTIELACTAEIDGETVDLTIPGGASIVLDADNGYLATVGPLPVDSACEVTETETGGADEVTYEPADGLVSISDDVATTVTVINRFDAPPSDDTTTTTTPDGVGSGEDSQAPGGELSRTGTDGDRLRLMLLSGFGLLASGIVVLSRTRRHRRRI